MSAVPFTLNGLKFNTVTGFPRFTGSMPLPSAGARYSSGARVQQGGQWSTTAYREALAFGLTGVVRCQSTFTVPDAVGSLDTAFSLRKVPLTVHWPSGDRTILVHRDGEVSASVAGDRVVVWDATVVADDPTWYLGGPPVPLGPGLPIPPSDKVSSWTTTLPASTGGLSFPFFFPFSFDATVTSGDVLVASERGGWWTFKVQGPVVNPRIIVLLPDGTQRVLAWKLELDASEFLVVDPQRQSAMLQGTASRPPVVRQWAVPAPGTNTVQFRADSGSGVLTVYYVPSA